MLNVKNIVSNSSNQENLAARINLSWTAIVKQFEFIPNTAFSLRDQSDYEGSQRDEHKYEVGLSCKAHFNNKKTSIKVQLQFAEQYSNLSAFKYNNTRFALAGNHKF